MGRLTPRALVKRAVESVATVRGVRSLVRHLSGPASAILAYHNIVPDDEPAPGERSLHLSRSAFVAQLEYLRQTCTIVPLSEILSPPSTTTRPRVAITFDDAYDGALSIGFPELKSRGLQATLFVAPGLLSATGCWWDLLAQWNNGVLEPSLRDAALGEHQGKGERVSQLLDALAGGRPTPALPSVSGISSEASLWAATEFPGITLAPHSWSHPNLAVLPPAEVESECRSSLSWLEARFPGRVMRWLAYPYGLCSDQTCAIARRLGFESALTIGGGALSHDADPFRLPRINVSAGLSLAGLELRLTGLVRDRARS